MKNNPDNKCITVNTRYTKPEYDFMMKKTKKAKMFRGEHNKIPCLSVYTRSKTLEGFYPF